MFSVAPVSLNGRVLGYLYVVVGGELYQTWVMRLHDSHILGSAAVVAGTVVLAGALAGLIGFWYLTRRLTRLAGALQEFELGGFDEPPRGLLDSGRRLVADEIDDLKERFAGLVKVILRQVRQLRAADVQLRESITGVSHDLRTPLTAIRGYLDTVPMKNETLTASERRKYLELAIAQHARLARLVRAQFELAQLAATLSMAFARRQVCTEERRWRRARARHRPTTAAGTASAATCSPGCSPASTAEVGPSQRARTACTHLQHLNARREPVDFRCHGSGGRFGLFKQVRPSDSGS